MKTCIHALPSRDRNRWTRTTDNTVYKTVALPLSYVPVCFSDRTTVIRISNNLFPRGICNPYAPLVPIARRFYQLYADLFINVCNIYSYPRSTQTMLRRYVINCLYGKVRMKRIGYI